MMYMDYTNEIPLPDQTLGLYSVQSFVFDLQKKEAVPRWSASARLMSNPLPWYHRNNSIPEGPTFTSYADLNQPGSSHMYQPEHAGWESSHIHQPEHVGWEQPAPQHIESS